jgi:hypothetical protein
MVMKRPMPHHLSNVCLAAALALAPLPAAAQGMSTMGGMKHEDTAGGMKHEDAAGGMKHEGESGGMMGGGMMGGMMHDGMMGGMMGGGMGDMSHMMSMMMDHMSHMMSMMHEKVAHTGDRIASLKSELKITEAQTPAWNKFADALLAAAKSMEQSLDATHKQMMQAAAGSLPEQLDRHAKLAAANAANLNAIKAALDPLYASFSDEQKKIADELKIGPMGVM